MNPFWASLFQELRGHGRNGTLFIVVLLLLLVAAVFVVKVPEEAYRDYVLPVTVVVSILAVMWFVRGVLTTRARQRERLTGMQLSRDELDKARSKLVKGTNRKPL
jgi:uncharacterized membrane protein (DUF4010 family)